MAQKFYDFSALDIKGQEVKMDSFRGKVLLVVNVASKCGFTKGGYEGMSKLKNLYGNQGLEILAFPCNQFAHQEPGTNEEICQFIGQKASDVILFDKIEVNGDKTHPLFAFLKKQAKGVLNTEFIKWNFTKFLIDRDGTPIRRYGPNETFDSIAPEVERLLNATK